MNVPINSIWDGVERRKPNSCRRKGERRNSPERRYDYRKNGSPPKRGIVSWARTLTNARLGVDRRRRKDQRTVQDRRNPNPRSLLTKEELTDLLK